ncbi:PRC-barrel domain-containing protein [Kamptonema formosum]|uniref:PRC-barrel domain-containing protein n=1 Tax=Kamptonema formosum TaxID=331992 RepID=UPI00034999BA|nr:PRC-barrel domain-containing protein [Oscillatoria sp. PCC 10802]
MADQKVIKQSELINRLVIDRTSTEEVGRADQLWLNPQSHQVVGLACKSGFLGKNKRSFTWAQIESIGADSIIVSLSAGGEDAEKPEGAISGIGYEVWTDAGNKVGKIVDYLFVPNTGAVVSYLYSSSGWRGVLEGIYLLFPAAISSAGSKRVIVAEAAVQNPQHYAEGLSQKIGQAAEFLKEDCENTLEHLENARRRAVDGTQGVKRGAQQLAEELQEKVQDVREKATEGAQTFAEQAKQKAQAAREQAAEGAQTFAEQARQKAQIVREQAAESAQHLAEQARQKAQAAREQAQAKIAEVQTRRQEPSPPASIEIADGTTPEKPPQ